MASGDDGNFIRRLEGKVKPWMLVAGLVGLLLLGFCKETRAETYVELGGTFASGESSDAAALVVGERFGNYTFSLGVMDKQSINTRTTQNIKTRQNGFFEAMRVTRPFSKLEVGLGGAYFMNTNRALSSNLNFALMVRYELSDKFSLQLRHWSNAGTNTPNLGQDMITLRYTF